MLREYSNITNADCLESSRPSAVVRQSQVFESDFSTLDDAIPGDLMDELEAGETTNLSGARASQGQTGWSVVSRTPDANLDATLLYDDPSKAAAPIQSQATLRPQVLPQMLSAPASGLSASQNPVSTSKSVLIGLLTAAAMILVVVVVFVTRPGPSDTTVTPMALPPPVQVPMPIPPTATVLVGTGVTSENPPTPEPTHIEDRVVDAEPDESENQSQTKKKAKIGVMSIRGPKGVNAKVYVDGKEQGFAPLVYHKVTVGKHTVKLIEVVDGKPGRSTALDVNVRSKHTRKSPLFLDVEL
ncbi:MAG: hypothetical protein A2341_01725 [Deltaproteobacteria bacterium RIFOXYB12_FULL_58_9]|nr:MAG: hypothetical protein A2341_01725 [Deltaproteobacteria bacterium RIFOXYB12_FULL_58_9]